MQWEVLVAVAVALCGCIGEPVEREVAVTVTTTITETAHAPTVEWSVSEQNDEIRVQNAEPVLWNDLEIMAKVEFRFAINGDATRNSVAAQSHEYRTIPFSESVKKGDYISLCAEVRDENFYVTVRHVASQSISYAYNFGTLDQCV